jgi:nanoRNase/pAp phosphatase (c-di-AMP/oligoRNAs hydrolase)
MKLVNSTIRESLNRVKKKLLPAESILIIPHNFPDPDSIGSAMGLKHLLQSEGVTKCDIAFNGFVGRAENRAMVELLEIECFTLSDIDLKQYDKIAVVDTTPNNGNISIEDPSSVDVVLDHHAVTDKSENSNTLFEINLGVGATSTLVTLYLIANNTPISKFVATALFYGIKTDTNDMGRNTHDIDIASYKILFDLIDHKILSQIEHPPREPVYFQLLYKASQEMRIYGDFAYTHIGEVNIPDFVPEMADICHSLESVEWMVCSAIFKNQIIFSVRSKKSPNAGVYTRNLAKKLNGSGGGHPTMAAGRIDILEKTAQDSLEIFKENLFDTFSVKSDSSKSILDYK